jgi:hypothetical protein
MLLGYIVTIVLIAEKGYTMADFLLQINRMRMFFFHSVLL